MALPGCPTGGPGQGIAAGRGQLLALLVLVCSQLLPLLVCLQMAWYCLHACIQCQDCTASIPSRSHPRLPSFLPPFYTASRFTPPAASASVACCPPPPPPPHTHPTHTPLPPPEQKLDFDFEKCCSVSLSHINVYVCLVCGKYFQVSGVCGGVWVSGCRGGGGVARQEGGMARGWCAASTSR